MDKETKKGLITMLEGAGIVAGIGALIGGAIFVLKAFDLALNDVEWEKMMRERYAEPNDIMRKAELKDRKYFGNQRVYSDMGVR